MYSPDENPCRQLTLPLIDPDEDPAASDATRLTLGAGAALTLASGAVTFAELDAAANPRDFSSSMWLILRGLAWLPPTTLPLFPPSAPPPLPLLLVTHFSTARFLAATEIRCG